MVYDKEAKLNIEIGNNKGQINISNDSSIINATNNVNIDKDKNKDKNDIQDILIIAEKIIELVKRENISERDKDNIIDDVDIIKEQVISEKPNVTRLKKAIGSLAKLDTIFVKGTSIALAMNEFYQQASLLLNKLGAV